MAAAERDAGEALYETRFAPKSTERLLARGPHPRTAKPTARSCAAIWRTRTRVSLRVLHSCRKHTVVRAIARMGAGAFTATRGMSHKRARGEAAVSPPPRNPKERKVAALEAAVFIVACGLEDVAELCKEPTLYPASLPRALQALKASVERLEAMTQP